MKQFLSHYVLYAVLLLTLCLGVFPFFILYSGSKATAETLDRFSSGGKAAAKVEAFWDAIGKPYDFLVKTVG